MVICTIAIDEDLICEEISDSFVVERKEALEEDDIGRANRGCFLESGVLDERVLRDLDRCVGIDEIEEGLVGEIKVKGVGVIKIILSDVYLSLIDIFMKERVLL